MCRLPPDGPLQDAATDSIRTSLHFYTDDLRKNQGIFRDIGQIGRSSSLIATAARALAFVYRAGFD